MKLQYLKQLEEEAVYIFRESAALFNNPAILFSGGKDSTVLIHLAIKAFFPAPIPFKILHIDTGHNFPEALDFRNSLVKKYNLTLYVRNVVDTIEKYNWEDAKGKFPSRNALQSFTLMDAIHELNFDACIGGGRRDEDKARAKERIFSIRDQQGKWQPHHQKPELWKMFNAHLLSGQHMRVFPISNWTELDIWNYVKNEHIELPTIYYSHLRQCLRHQGRLIALSQFIQTDEADEIIFEQVRFRTVGDMTCTAAITSNARSIEEVISEIEKSTVSERGETRLDDRLSDASMEDRKSNGYF
jgi:sulfate adenylyltransferase subunit 2